MDWELLTAICFYGSLPLLAVIAFAIWATVKRAGWADKHEVKPDGSKRTEWTQEGRGRQQHDQHTGNEAGHGS